MSDWIVDASTALTWVLEDELDRAYSLEVLRGLATHRVVVPVLWFHEMGNALTMACRRQRITFTQAEGFLARLATLPIRSAEQSPATILQLPRLARDHNLTNYDAAYLDLALRLGVPLATQDKALRRAAAATGVRLLEPSASIS